MANPRLSNEQRTELFAPLLKSVNAQIFALSVGDSQLMWAIRRKLAKELIYIERSTPAARNKLKASMWTKQGGKCAICSQTMPQKGSELDRTEAYLGYVESNVRLVHHECHVNDQEGKRYA